MSSNSVEEYSSRFPGNVPQLFSRTNHFRFLQRDGELVHRSLPLGCKGYQIVAVNSTGHEIKYTEEDRVTVSLPVSGHADVRCDTSEFQVRPGSSSVIGPSDRYSKLSPSCDSACYSSFAIIAPPGRLLHTVKEGGWHVIHKVAELEQLRDLLDLGFKITGSPRRNPTSMLSSLEALIEDMLEIDLVPIDGSGPKKVRRNDYLNLSKRAQEHMRENFARPLSVYEIAAEIDVSMRTLQLAFKISHGRPPRQILNDIRMEEMRKMLLNPGDRTSVTSAALDAGLVHLGRSSKRYFDRYGEFPSDTLRRARET